VRPPLATLLPVVALAATAPAAGADSFVDTTPGTMAFAVPAGVQSLSVRVTAGAGGDLINNSGTTLVQGGRGALVTGTVAVFPGEQLQLTVGTNGGKANAQKGTNGAGGAPDGGTGGYSAGGGGGATRVLGCQGVICPVAVIAAGGGGAGASGFVSSSPLPGGAGGAASAPGGDGTSDGPVSGGSGGRPGTSGADGTGGVGADAGDDGSGPSGGAGGNHSGSFNLHEGGGGGGGGVFGGGGGGSGAFGMDGSDQVFTGGGGGGGGSSFAPSGGNVQKTAAGAVPRIVLTWGPPDTKITKVNVKKHSANFSFKAVGVARGFQCELLRPKRKHHKKPKASFSACMSPKTYKHLKSGHYTFEVRAFNAAGVDATPATANFKI
jgi:hypothetical protein